MTYIRKTKDEYHIEGNYGYGWETVCVEETRQEAKVNLWLYRENEKEYQFRVTHKRVKKDS